MFHPGQHVVCIDDKNIERLFGEDTPSKGVVYTIVEHDLTTFDFPTVELAELGPVWIDGKGYRRFWSADRFRPLQKLRVEDFLNVRTPTSTEIA